MRIFLAFVMLLMMAPVAKAQGMPIIRDAEIEITLERWAAPLIRAAGMGPNSVRIVVVNGDDVNAFVAGGANIFIFSGLILEARTPQEVTGVIAHELGHIAGGHLIAGREAARRASYETILTGALGLGVAAATGEGGAAAAIGSAGRHVAERDYLTHSRGQESSADQAALSFMERARMNPSGLSSFLAHLGGLNPSIGGPQAAYTRTHPLTTDRLSALERRGNASPYKDADMDAQDKEAFDRMQAKLMGFLHPDQVVSRYSSSDTSIASRSARAIAAYRQSRVQEALAEVNALLQKEPANPYFLELKGQILFETGKVQEALVPYARAVALAPDSGLIRLSYGHALLEAGQADEAIRELERAVKGEPRTPKAQRLLATAYGRTGDEPRAKLHLAEEAALLNHPKEAKAHANAALKSLPAGSPAALQAQDLLMALDSLKKKD